MIHLHKSAVQDIHLILHSIPELATTVVGGEIGVGEGEWFGGAAINSMQRSHAQLR